MLLLNGLLALLPGWLAFVTVRLSNGTWGTAVLAGVVMWLVTMALLREIAKG